MISNIKNKIFSIHKIIGIEIKFESEDDFNFNFILLERENDKVLIKNLDINCLSFNDFIKQLPKDTPISLNFSGKGIISKRIDLDSNLDEDKIIDFVLPGSVPSSFYVQYAKNEKFIFSQIAKKNKINYFVEQFKGAGLFVVNISFSFLPLIELHFIFKRLNFVDTINLGCYKFLFNSDQVESVSLRFEYDIYETIKIGEDELSFKLLIPYVAGLQTFIGGGLISNLHEILTDKEEFIHKNLFPKLFTGVICFIFIILIINAFTYKNFFDTYNKLQIEKNTSNKTLNLAKELERKYSENEAFLKASGWNTPTKISYFADRIAFSLTPNIVLLELSINTVDHKKWKEQNILEFRDGFVRIVGNCKRSVDLNNWIKSLSQLDFVTHVDVKNYSHDQYENLGKFELDILIK